MLVILMLCWGFVFDETEPVLCTTKSPVTFLTLRWMPYFFLGYTLTTDPWENWLFFWLLLCDRPLFRFLLWREYIISESAITEAQEESSSSIGMTRFSHQQGLRIYSIKSGEYTELKIFGSLTFLNVWNSHLTLCRCLVGVIKSAHILSWWEIVYNWKV